MKGRGIVRPVLDNPVVEIEGRNIARLLRRNSAIKCLLPLGISRLRVELQVSTIVNEVPERFGDDFSGEVAPRPELLILEYVVLINILPRKRTPGQCD